MSVQLFSSWHKEQFAGQKYYLDLDTYYTKIQSGQV